MSGQDLETFDLEDEISGGIGFVCSKLTYLRVSNSSIIASCTWLLYSQSARLSGFFIPNQLVYLVSSFPISPLAFSFPISPFIWFLHSQSGRLSGFFIPLGNNFRQKTKILPSLYFITFFLKISLCSPSFPLCSPSFPLCSPSFPLVSRFFSLYFFCIFPPLLGFSRHPTSIPEANSQRPNNSILRLSVSN